MGQWAHLYNTPRWRAIRKHQLEKAPLCAMCEAAGKVKAANVCDHIEPHRGDLGKFYCGPFQSLCQSCHSGDKQAIEKSGLVRRRIGEDGWPIT